MSKKQFFITIDTETTMDNKVVDFGAIVSDRKGNIVNQCAVIVAGVYKVSELFHNEEIEIWKKEYLPKRYKLYDDMLINGLRMLASVDAINRWLSRVNAKYNPIMTAYNLPFDVDKMRKTGIDCDIFEKSFCLWGAAKYHLATKKPYKKFALENHYFTNRTKLGNMSIRTSAEIMTHYLTGNDTAEPHTAIEDVLDYELPILNHLLKKMSTKKLVNFDYIGWQGFQVKNHFTH